MIRRAVFNTSTGAIRCVVESRSAALIDLQAGAGEATIDAPDDADGEVREDTHVVSDPGGTPTLTRTHTVEWPGDGGPPDLEPV